MDVTTAESPGWWAARLHRQLKARQQQLDMYDRYYRGQHDMPDVPDQLKSEIDRFLAKCRSNYMGLVVDAPLERCEVMGFRVGEDTAGDDEVWAIWQASRMDLRSQQAFLEAFKAGQSYLMVGPNPANPALPIITAESPAQVIVEYAPGSDVDRDAALKVWYDDRRNLTLATLFLRDEIYKFQGPRSSSPARWVAREIDGEDWPLRNTLGVVPVVELQNNPQLGVGGVSELEGVIEIQDRINLTLVDRLLTQVGGAFPQKYGTKWTAAPNEIKTDEAGNKTFQPAPIELGRMKILRFEQDVNLGQFLPADLEPYLAAKTSDVKDIASAKKIPTQYLLGDMVNVSAEGMQVAESGLVSKVNRQLVPFGEGLEEAMSLALELAGKKPDAAMHTIWRDPQFRSIAQLTDAVIKQFAAGIITLEVAQEKLGFSPQEIQRMSADLRAKQLQDAAAASLGQALAQPNAPAVPVGA